MDLVAGGNPWEAGGREWRGKPETGENREVEEGKWEQI